ncbi:MAG: RHS repeat protein, partial [Chloroflexi bacterium]|nr:RHS repeat protein [Chloroflexota bacterium]
DNLGRDVTLEYDANGDLSTVTDTLGLATSYEYSGTTHLLTKVTDPSGTVLEETAFDNEGRAYQQWDGAGNLLVEIDYSLANTRVVTENGVVMTYTYDTRNTLIGIQYACTDGTAGCQANSDIAYDGNFKQDSVMDLNDNPTTLSWNAGGSNLEYVKDALDNETFLTYDSYNNLTQTVDARGITSSYFYDNASFPTFLTQMSDGLGNSTFYTPTTIADGVPGLLKQQEDPNGRITTYSYNDFGQITEIVAAAGSSEAITTTYGYDAVGRLTTTTQTSAAESHTSLNVYDDGNRLIAAIANWDSVLDWQNCSFAGGGREENICTLYDYDNAGRIISTTNALGQTHLTFYDAAGRNYLNVSNWDGSSYSDTNPLPDLCNFGSPDPEFNLCSETEYDAFGRAFRSSDSLGRQSVTEYDSLGRVSRSISNWQDGVFNANDPDADIQTLYEFDANGNTLIVTDTIGRMSRTFYDALNRVEGTISNWDGTTTLAGCSSLPTMRDSNICSQYQYDEVGNTIIVTDTLGRMTRTFYDNLNRVEATVANWQPSFTSPANCVLSATNEAVENVCTVYGYDDVGNQITTTNALNQTSLTVYDAANRPFLTVRNWDGTSISSENDCSFPPAQSDTNVCSVTYYDTLGRRSSSKDSMGSLTDYEYDGLGRLITTTRYL